MKKRNRLIQRICCSLLSAALLMPYATVCAADEDTAETEYAMEEEEASGETDTTEEEDTTDAPEEKEEQEEALTAVSWPTPAADWYEAYHYTLKEETGVIELNFYKKDNTAEYVVVPGTAVIGGKSYAVELNTIDPDGSTQISLWGSYNQTIKGIRILDGVKARHCKNLFYSLPELTDLDLSGLDTGGVTDMTNFLCYSRKLTNLTLGELDTSSVTNMNGMFEGISVSSLDLRGFDTTQVTTMSQMFYQCGELTGLDLSSFATPKLTDMSYMFYECEKLETIRWGDGLDTSNVTQMYDLFTRCSKLTDAGIERFATGKVESMSGMFHGCNAMAEIDLRHFDFTKVESMSYMFYDCASIRTVLFPEEMRTPALTDMDGMFESCDKLLKVDLSGFDTGNVMDMSNMFNYDDQLREVLFGERFVTSKVENMRGMFRQCFRLQVLDVSGFDTSNVKDMDSMFESCDSLRTIDVSGFNTSKVTDMSDMFYNCVSLLTLDVSHFDTSNVTDMYHMFRGCSRLRSLDLSSFNTEKVENFFQLLFECRDLTVADLRSFDFSAGTTIEKSGSGDLHSFIGDSGIRQLYLPVKAMRGFDFAKDLAISGESGYALTDIFYAGTEEQWQALENVVPGDIRMHYEFSGEAMPIEAERTPVSSISLAAHEITLKPGDYKYVKTDILPENATDRGTGSISSDPLVAYSDSYATIWAVNPGSCTITVYALDGSGVSDTIAVTVTEADKKLVGMIKLDKTELKLKAGESKKLTATISPSDAEDRRVEWSSNNEAVATVDQDGNVTAVADGTASIRVSAKDGSGVSAECKVTVGKSGNAPGPVDPPAPVPGSNEATDPQPEITTEATQELTLVVGQKFNVGKGWSSNSKNLSVNKKTGAVKAKKAGTATMSHEDGAHTISVTIVKPSVKKSTKLEAGATETLTVTGTEGMNILWTSSAPDIATVNEEGLVTAVAKGSAKITAWVNGSAYKCSVKVTETTPAKERTLHLNVNGGSKTVKIKGLTKPEWKLEEGSEEGIVEILSGKKIKGKAAGTVTLVSGNGEYKVDVTVEDPTIVGSAAKTPYKKTEELNVGGTASFKLTGITQDVVFKSSKSSVAFVSPLPEEDGNYMITARGKGKAKLTAKVNGKTITITVKVK